jgi:hypothetical protein
LEERFQAGKKGGALGLRDFVFYDPERHEPFGPRSHVVGQAPTDKWVAAVVSSAREK